MKDLKELKQFLKLKEKECSGLQKSFILKRLKKCNEKFKTSHSIKWKQVGQADIYLWEIIERWNNYYNEQPSGKSVQLRLF
jgi:hypothetical protein